ncbi:MAG: cytochrome ubiquinol oxidase subunit I [Fervidicoccaceae archaeon]
MQITGLLDLSATGIYFHAISVSITLGFPLAIASLLYKYSRTGDESLLRAARITTIILMINFALGAITGTLVEFGLVQIWSGTLVAIATSAFAPLAAELIAFVMEVALLILFYVTLGKFSAKKSLTIILSYWAFAILSGILITSVNSWLVSPWGTGNLAESIYPFMPDYGPVAMDPSKLLAVKIIMLATGLPLQSVLQDPIAAQKVGILITDPYIALKNPYNISSSIHNITAAIIIGTSIAILAWSYRYYKTKDDRYVKILASFFIPFLVLMILQPTLFGHLMGTSVVEYNPTKFSMMEGAVEQISNPLVSLLAYGNPNHPIMGIKDYENSCELLGNKTLSQIASQYNLTAQSIKQIAGLLNIELSDENLSRVLNITAADVCKQDLSVDLSILPTINVLYYTKIAGGILALLSSLALAGLLYRIPLISPISRAIDKLLGGRKERTILILAVLIALGAATASVLGWYVREVGRKPWTVYGLLYPSELATTVPTAYSLSFLLIAFLIILSVNILGLAAMAYVALNADKVSEYFRELLNKIRGENS